MDTVFVDTDIIIDLLAAREPFYEYAAALFSLADKGKVKICVSPLLFSNVNYLLTRQYNADQARKKLLKFKTLVTVNEVNDKTIELALASDFKDFEDGIQYFTAIENGIRLLLTRNLKDYKSADIPVMTAEDYIKQLDK
jgi:predicted nucleic acid-binding protein